MQQAKLTKAESELNAAMELLQKKEEEVRQCQMLYDEAMTTKQVDRKCISVSFFLIVI